MDDQLIMKWQAREGEYRPKGNSWYIGVGIVAIGLAVAAVIIQNYLFALISVLGGFAVMVVGSRRPARKTYALYERHIAVGTDIIPYEKVSRFAIREDDPRELVLELKNLIGVAAVPLGNADHRRIRMELKNRDIEEVEKLDVFVGKVANWIGL
jgi:hypothetical protein